MGTYIHSGAMAKPGTPKPRAELPEVNSMYIYE